MKLEIIAPGQNEFETAERLEKALNIMKNNRERKFDDSSLAAKQRTMDTNMNKVLNHMFKEIQAVLSE